MQKYDVIVAGGGFAGTAAAISAARGGAKVLIIDKGNSFGGAAANCLVNPYMLYWTINPETKQKKVLSAGLFSEINAELAKFGATKPVNDTDLGFHEEYLKLVLNRMVLKEKIDILFNSYIHGCKTEEGKIKSVTVVNKSGNTTYAADVFIDCTGDADIAVMSGCPYRLGREEDNLCQPMTLCFRVVNVDMEQFKKDRQIINTVYKEHQAAGKIKNIREDVLTFYTLIDGVIHFNSTRVVKKNPTDGRDITLAELDAREQVFELFDFLKANFASFKNAAIMNTAAQIGVRESRMIIGKYVLTQEDLLACTHFDDTIATCNYDIDIHNPEGSGTSHYYFKPGDYYTIPYRCLVPNEITNLLVAGRCISSTHEAQASYRIMPVCCCLGEAAGTAAALAVQSGNFDVEKVDIATLQKTLKDNGAVID